MRGTPGDGTRFTFPARFDGRPFEGSPYYGARITHWLAAPPDWGVALDFARSKLYADDATLERSGFGRLRFTG